jgi:CubicO group peptidase (beta-lactamase class C family)
VVIYDMAQAVGEKRGAQVALIFDKLLPKGYSRETFAGKKAQRLDAARIAKLTKFIEDAQQATGVPGVSLGLIQDGKVVFSGGLGTRELGGSAKVDGDTLYMIASNTKGLTTLLLAKLVDAGKITWKQPVTQLLPQFKLGNADTTRRVLVEHLICALYRFAAAGHGMVVPVQRRYARRRAGHACHRATDEQVRRDVPVLESARGAAGFTAGHVLYPQLEIGAAYDKAMQTEVFDPLGMKATTFDYARASSGNHSIPHAPDVDGKPARAVSRAQLLHHPSAPSRRRLEQRERHAEVRVDGARERRAARRPSLHLERAVAGAARSEGADRQGCGVRHGPRGRHHIWRAGRASRRRHGRLS